jgi:hypothetical protein
MAEDFGTVEDFGVSASQVEDFGEAEDFGAIEEAPQSVGMETKGKPLAAAKAAGNEFLAAADTILGSLGGAISLGGTLIGDVVALASGDETPFQTGRKLSDEYYGNTKLGKFLAKPLETMLDNEKAMKGTLVNEVFSYLGGQLEKGGEAIGGGEKAAAAGQAVETALTLLGVKALKKDLNYLNKPTPNELTMDGLLEEFDNYKANQPKPQLTQQDELPFTNDINDAPKPVKSDLPENYYQQELQFQDELPLGNEAVPQTPAFSQLVDSPMPNKQDTLDLTNEMPAPRQPDMFEPEAYEALMSNNKTVISSAQEKYKFAPTNQEALDLAARQSGIDPKGRSFAPERVIQNTPTKPSQDFLNLERPTKASTPEISKAADEMIEDAPLDPKLQKKRLEDLSNDLTQEEWTKEFMRRNPDRDLEAADFAYKRLQPEKAINVTLGKGADDFLKVGFGTFFTRLGNIDEGLLQKSLQYEQNLLQKPHQIYKEMDTVFNAVEKFPPAVKDSLEKALKSGDKDAMYKAFAYAGRPDLFKAFDDKILKTVSRLGKEAKEAGVLPSLRDDYFLPRVVKDYAGLAKALGKNVDVSKIDAAIRKAEKAAFKKGERFGDVERTKVINQFVRGYPKPDSYKAGYRKERKFDEIPEELQQFYHPTRDALHMYIKNISDDIETFKFLGRNVKRNVDGKINLEESIGAHIDELRLKGKIDPDKADELQALYTARFIGGNRSPNKAVQTSKNLASGLLLSGLSSTALQVTELLPLIALSQPQMINGLKGAIKTAVQTLKGKTAGRLNAQDLGLVDHYMNTEVQRYTGKGVGTKFANASAALADASLKLNFFKQADIALKTFNLNTQLAGAEYQLKTPQGRKLFANDWKARYGEDLPQLMRELQQGKITPLTTNYAFSQLAKTQAISKGNWTVWSLDNPNARLFTTLKTFAINQLQMLQSEAVRKIKRGETRDGIKSLAKVATALTLAGAGATEIRDFVMGREDAPAKLGDIGLAMMKVVGLQERTLEEAKKGEVGKAALGYVTPPFEMLDAPLSDALLELQGEDSQERYLDLLPGGREFRSRFRGGAETYAENQESREGTED